MGAWRWVCSSGISLTIDNLQVTSQPDLMDICFQEQIMFILNFTRYFNIDSTLMCDFTGNSGKIYMINNNFQT